MDSAWLAWIRTFDLKVESLEDVADGQIISEVLHTIDPEAFKNDPRDQKASNNWVLRFNALKRLHKLLLKYYDTHEIGLPSDTPAPNLSSIAKDQNVAEIVQLLKLVLVAAVASDQRDEFVQRIGRLEPEEQSVLMNAIESLQQPDTQFAGLEPGSPYVKNSSELRNLAEALSQLRAEKEEITNKSAALEAQCQALLEDQHKLEQENTKMKIEIERLTEVAQVLNAPIADEDASQLNRQYQELQNQFLLTESHLAEKVTETIEQAEKISQLEKAITKKTDVVDAATLSKIQEELADHQQVIANNRKLEIVNEKYKKKITQDVNEIAVFSERISQLERQKRELEYQAESIKQTQNRLEDCQKEIRVLTSAATESKRTEEALSLELQNNKSLLRDTEASLTEALARIDLEASRKGPATSTQTGGSSKSEPDVSILRSELDVLVEREVASLRELLNRSIATEVALSEKLKASEREQAVLQAQLQAVGGNIDGTTVKEKLVAAKLQMLEEQLVGQGERLLLLQQQTMTKDIELELVKRHLSPESLETVRATAQERAALWQSKEKEVQHLEAKLQAFEERASANGGDDRQTTDASATHELIQTLQQALEEKKAEIAHNRAIQLRTKKVLKQQDVLLKGYREKYENLKKQNADTSAEADLALKDQEIAALKREGKEREARFKQENSIVAASFYDMAGRLAANHLTIQRASAAPESFLSSKRLALGVLSPQSSRVR